MSKKKLFVFILMGATLIAFTAVILVNRYLNDEWLNERGTQFIMDEVRSSLAQFREKCGKYPSSLDELNLKAIESCPGFQGPGERKIRLTDRWGNRFIYMPTDDGFSLRSMGSSWIEATDSLSASVIAKPK